MAAKFTYSPEIPEDFHCRVPLPGTQQAFVMNGKLKDRIEENSLLTVLPRDSFGFDLTVAKEAVLPGNLQIISIRNSANPEPVNYTNNFSFGEGSESNILLCSHTLSMNEFKTDSELNIDLSRRAKVNIVIMQNEHNKSAHKVKFNITLARDSYIRVNIVSLHGGFLENDIDVKLVEEGSICELNGIYLVDGVQEIRTNVNIHHLVPKCQSKQLFKGILDDESKALFFGKIIVSKDAQKTEAYQANHNLLLSRKAKVYAQPQLEIYADDVKCSHGATSGRLDELALFYMRSRGIGAAEAKLLQQLAFVYDVLEKINDEQLRQRLQNLVESRLRGEFKHCTNCSMNCC
ncbi:MAG: Fe-S cluster assembly protein SufD [Bacteroidales bacterium]